MPESLRALIVILFLGGVVFLSVARTATAAIRPEDFARRRNLWFAITLAAFLAHDVWLYAAVTVLMLWIYGPRDSNRLAMYYFLLFALPALSEPIPGFAGIQQIVTVTYPRLLSLTLLLPAFLVIQSRPAAERSGFGLPDKLIGAYILLLLVLQFENDSFTNTLRSAIYAFLDVFLPYYVASRSLKNLAQFRDVIMSFVVAALVLAAIGLFEFAKKWLLYSTLGSELGLQQSFGDYLLRDGSLRALATTGQPIALGYVMAVAGGLYLYLARTVENRNLRLLGYGGLLVGLLAPVSRGPWIGFAVMLAAFALTDRKPVWSLFRLGLAAGILAPFVLITPLGDKIVEYLPFVGSVDNENVVYRQRLFDASIAIIKQNPWFGSRDFLFQMEELRQGQGIIDIVNSYLGIALSSGLVGLSLFAGFFLTIGGRLLAALRRLGRGDAGPEGEELRQLARALLATLAGILVIIVTVSSITVIPLVYWSVAGFCLACTQLLEKRLAPQASRAANLPMRPARFGA